MLTLPHCRMTWGYPYTFNIADIRASTPAHGKVPTRAHDSTMRLAPPQISAPGAA